MKKFFHFFCALILAVTALAGGDGRDASSGPFEVTFLKRLPDSDIAPVYDPQLPGYRLDAQIATVKIRPLADKLPNKLVLMIRTTLGLPPMLEGFSLQTQGRSVSASLKFPTEEIRDAAQPHKAEVRVREYFEMKVVGQDVQILFLPKAMELLRNECTITWVDWYRR